MAKTKMRFYDLEHIQLRQISLPHKFEQAVLNKLLMSEGPGRRGTRRGLDLLGLAKCENRGQGCVCFVMTGTRVKHPQLQRLLLLQLLLLLLILLLLQLVMRFLLRSFFGCVCVLRLSLHRRHALCCLLLPPTAVYLVVVLKSSSSLCVAAISRLWRAARSGSVLSYVDGAC